MPGESIPGGNPPGERDGSPEGREVLPFRSSHSNSEDISGVKGPQ